MIRKMFTLSLLGLFVSLAATVTFGSSAGMDISATMASLATGGEHERDHD